MVTPWLPLTEYSTKYKVSVSTLRRRIKAEDIRFRFEDGKYLIFDEALTTGLPQRVHRPSLKSDEATPDTLPKAPTRENIPSPRDPEPTRLTEQERSEIEAHLMNRSNVKDGKDEPILLAANKLLNELKRAYSQILHEKEEQILQLKQEAVDLKTLVRVLESENGRLRESGSNDFSANRRPGPPEAF